MHVEPFLTILAHVYLEHGFAQRARVLLQALDLLGLLDNKNLALLALAEQNSGDPEAALKAIERIEKLNNNATLGAAVALIRAQALHKLGRADDALAAMSTYVHLRNNANHQLRQTTTDG